MGRDYTEQHNFLQLIEALEKPAIPQPIEIIEQPENKNDTDTTTDPSKHSQKPLLLTLLLN